jgi:ubiquinone/menaquinone biosynthesis C-methylase UbiE
MVSCLGKRIYKDIAPYYDKLMDDVNYEAWIAYIKNICALNHCEPRTVLDLGCGTGIPALFLLKDGCSVIGVDGSLEMLRVAQTKLADYAPVLIQSSFERFHIKKKVDLAISLFDSLNNLIDENSLQKAFLQVAQCLHDNGLFVFDMNTIYGLRHMNDRHLCTKESNGVYSIWKSRFNRSKALITLSVTLFASENGLYRRVQETHLERGYPLSTLKRLLLRTGFKKITFYEHLMFRRPGPRTQRVMVVARRT